MLVIKKYDVLLVFAEQKDKEVEKYLHIES